MSTVLSANNITTMKLCEGNNDSAFQQPIITNIADHVEEECSKQEQISIFHHQITYN